MVSLSAPAAAAGTRVVEIPADAALDEPIVIAYRLADGEPPPATLVIAEPGARATIIERIAGGISGSVPVTAEVRAGAGAEVTYVAVQQAEPGTRLDVQRRSSAGTNARIDWCLAELGAAEATTDLIASLAEPGSTAAVTALFFPIRNESLTLRTEVLHAVGATTSTTVVRAVAAGRGRGRYYGNIRILPGAHGADASLRDDTLLIGEQARVDAVPALEIGANDVKAFHGATIGAIDPENIFYVMSRGIDRTSAEKLIALGFFEPAVVRFPGEELRAELRALLASKLAAGRG